MSVDQLRRAVQALPRAELPARMAHPLLPFPRPAPHAAGAFASPSRRHRPVPTASRMTCATASRRLWRRSATAMPPSPSRRSSAGSGRRRPAPDRLPDRPARAGGARRPRPHGGARAGRDPDAGGGWLPRPRRGLGLDAQADAGWAAPQAGAVHVRGGLWPAVQRGQQAGCGGP